MGYQQFLVAPDLVREPEQPQELSGLKQLDLFY
jgi:hypothetical protein